MFDETMPLNPDSVPGALTIFRRQAMACDFEIAFNASEAAWGADAAINALDEIERIEKILSIFQPTSLVSRINLLAAEMDIRLDPELFQWFEECQEISRQTDGAFDLTCSPLWEVWGFAKHQGKLPSESALQAALNLVGAAHVHLHPENLSISFDQPEVRVNFGGIGKGIALDCAAALLERQGCEGFMLNGGKSSIVTRGGRKGDFSPLVSFERSRSDENQRVASTTTQDRESENGPEKDSVKNPRRRTKKGPGQEAKTSLVKRPCWTIGVTNPMRPDQRIAELYLTDLAVGTSGSMQQFFRYRGQKLSHIINPKTGWPTTGILSVTVFAPSAMLADALSTAFFVMGPEKTQRYCDRHPETSALFILEQEVSPHYEVVDVNLPTSLWRRVDDAF